MRILPTTKVCKMSMGLLNLIKLIWPLLGFYMHWMYESEGEICVQTATFAVTLGLAVCMAVAFTTVGFVYWVRRSTPNQTTKNSKIPCGRSYPVGVVSPVYGCQSASTQSSQSALSSADSANSDGYQNLSYHRTASDLSVHSYGSNVTLDIGDRRKNRSEVTTTRGH